MLKREHIASRVDVHLGMPSQRHSLLDRLGRDISLAVRMVQMEYHDGYEVTCGVFDLFYCVDRKILREEFE